MNYQAALSYLDSLSRFGSKLGLERMEQLLAKMGNPEKNLSCLHIAGTNGKGSTVAMVSSILREAGLKVGTYTSPHLSSFRERIALSGEKIPRSSVAQVVEELMPLAQSVSGLTKFEFTTAMAFSYFQKAGADLVVLEVGMGGRLDATNVVVPVAAGITHLALDHTGRLGSTLAEIAGEKAGIIKEGRPTVVAPQNSEALFVVQARAQELGSPLYPVASWPDEGKIRFRGQAFSLAGSVADFWLEDLFLPRVEVGILGRHQLANAAVALGLAQRVYEAGLVGLEPSAWQAALRRGLEKARWPGRLEYFSGKPSLLLDGAHNPDGMEQLALFLQEFFPKARPTVVLGILGDKDYPSMLSELAPLAGKLIITVPDNPRAADPGELADRARSFGSQVEVVAQPQMALERALKGEELVVVAGSLYLVGELRGKIQTFFSQ